MTFAKSSKGPYDADPFNYLIDLNSGEDISLPKQYYNT